MPRKIFKNKSTYKKDKTCEDISTDFIMGSALAELLGLHDRVYDKKTQKSGVDVYLGKKNIPIDLKAVFKHIPTFSMEIVGITTGIHKDNPQKGWFIDEDKVTKKYLLLYHVMESNPKSLNSGKYAAARHESFSATEAILVDREAVLNYFFEKISVARTKMDEIAKEFAGIECKNTNKDYFIIDENGHIKSIFSKDDKPDVYFVKSGGKQEVPVNCIIKREVYESLGDVYYLNEEGELISKEDFYKIIKNLEGNQEKSSKI